MTVTPRRKFKANFKAKVALAAIKEQQPIEKICKIFSIQPYFFLIALKTKSSKKDTTLDSFFVLPKSVNEGRLYIKKI